MYIFVKFFLIILLSRSAFAFSETRFSVYVTNQTDKKLVINRAIHLEPRHQKILTRLNVSKNRRLQETFRLKGTVYFQDMKTIACRYGFISYTMLDSFEQEYKTFLFIDEKKNKIRCRGLALEVYPQSNTIKPKGKHLTIHGALKKHNTYRHHIESQDSLVIINPNTGIGRVFKPYIKRSH
tara:strand:- start:765 stop:1307 length:543 start_codon:yes stop_codon:yes gene_type:complete